MLGTPTVPEICGREEDDGSGGRVSARGGGHGQPRRVEPQPHVLQRRPELEELPGTNQRSYKDGKSVQINGMEWKTCDLNYSDECHLNLQYSVTHPLDSYNVAY